MEIKIKISEKDMDAIEDAFFTDLTEEEYMEIKPRLLGVWARLCKSMEKK